MKKVKILFETTGGEKYLESKNVETGKIHTHFHEVLHYVFNDYIDTIPTKSQLKRPSDAPEYLWYIQLKEYMLENPQDNTPEFFYNYINNYFEIEYDFAVNLVLHDVMKVRCFTISRVLENRNIANSIIQLINWTQLIFVVAEKTYETKNSITLLLEVCDLNSYNFLRHQEKSINGAVACP